jgi:enoyl-CoA hydratase/carnithine racemase
LLESPLHRHAEYIEGLMAGNDLGTITERLRALAGDQDLWLASAGKTFSKGSPTSAALSWALWQRATDLPLADVFRLEYQVSLGCCVHADFSEGVRALLIDKDKKPRWQPATLDDVTAAHVDAHFIPRHAGPHPLADLI